jgi:dihydrofolate reductase
MSLEVNLIVAMSKNRVIGINNSLPWHLPEDLKRFSKLTSGHAVLMGRKTFDSLPEKFRPLPNRLNLVLSRNVDLILPDGVVKINHIEDLFTNIEKWEKIFISDQLWVIGGEEIYRQTCKYAKNIFVTLVEEIYEGDAYFPEIEADFKLVKTEKKDGFSWLDYCKV